MSEPIIKPLSDEEFLEWCGNHSVKGCGGTRTIISNGEIIREVSRCEDCRAEASQIDTVRQIREWGEEWCNHTTVDDAPQFRRECDKCWQELIAEGK